tara:strand:+ start:2688 stop:4259 length:1572 start_codon:yes stop_codon:yes gene_type:complete
MNPTDFKNKQIQIIVNLINTRKFNSALNKSKPLIKKYPQEYIFYNAAAMSLINLEKYTEALKILEEAIQLNENNFFVLNNLGLAHYFLKNYELSEQYFNKILIIKPDFLNALINLSNLKKALNLNDEALLILERALKFHDKDYFLHFSIGTFYQNKGDFNKSTFHYEKCLSLKPLFTEVDRLISMSHKYIKNDPHLEDLQNKILDKNISELQKMHLYFALGKAYDDLGEYNRSFDNYKNANDIKDKKINYSFKLDNNIFSNIKNNFKTTSNSTTIKDTFDKKIIFIVGMPRSGTSLIEQVLSSHDKVYGAGELTFLTEAIYNEFFITKSDISEFKIDKINDDNLNNIKKFYFNNIDKFKFSEEYIVDKAPLNFRWIGFILKLFPNSFIINCTREPMDIAWSNYKQHFSSTNLGFAYNLDNIGKFYNLYSEFMSHWTGLYGEKIYEMNYEIFTNNFDEEVKKLLSFCKLEWSQKCVEFYNNKKSVITSSLAQVRKPIYKTSIASWKNYSDKLGELEKLIKENKS